MDSSLPQRFSRVEPSNDLEEVFRRLDDVAADLERIDSWRRPYGDGESDLQTARWFRRRKASRRGFPLIRMGDGR